MKLLIQFYICAMIIFAGSFPALSQWHSTFGWNGEDIVSLSSKGSFLFAATHPYDHSHRGIYRSSNYGTSWMELDNGLSDASITVVAATPQGVYAVSDSGSLFYSDDNGDKWKKISTIGEWVTGLTAMDGGGLFTSIGMNIYYSADNGKNWSEKGTEQLTSITANGDTLFGSYQYTTSWQGLSTRHGGVAISVDSGKTWQNSKDVLPDDYFYAMASKNGVVYAGSNGKGIYCSSDNGATWRGCNAFAGDPWDIYSLAATDSLLVAGNATGSFFRKPLSKLSDRMTEISNYPVEFFSNFNGTIYAGSSNYNGGLFFSRDNGTTWNGFDSSAVPSVKTLTFNDGVMLAGSNGWGVYISRDTGKTWTHSDTGFGNDKYVQKLAVSGRTILAATNNCSIYTSRDNGSTWYRSVRVSGTNNVAAFLVSGDTILAGGGDHVFRSVSNAASWTSIDSSPSKVTDFCVMGKTIFAATDGNGIYSSGDGGLSWKQKSNEFFSKKVTALASCGDLLFAGLSSYGVSFSSDKGETWTKVNTGLYDTSVLSLTVNNDTLFAGTLNRGIFRRPISEMISLGNKLISGNSHPVKMPIRMRISVLPGKQIAIDITASKSSGATVDIFSASGRLIDKVYKGNLSTANHRFVWNGSSFPSGCYIVRTMAGNCTCQKSFVFCRTGLN